MRRNLRRIAKPDARNRIHLLDKRKWVVLRETRQVFRDVAGPGIYPDWIALIRQRAKVSSKVREA